MLNDVNVDHPNVTEWFDRRTTRKVNFECATDLIAVLGCHTVSDTKYYTNARYGLPT